MCEARLGQRGDGRAVMFGRKRSQQTGYLGIPGLRFPPPPPADQVYYTSREHHKESPYKIGDRLPPTWEWTYRWPSWDRPVLVPGGCGDCDGRGYVLRAWTMDDGGTAKLHEGVCLDCVGTGRAGERKRQEAEEKRRNLERVRQENQRLNTWAQEQGYRDYGHYWYSERDRLLRESAAHFPPQCKKCGGSGRVMDTRNMINPNSDTYLDRPCPRCGGSGIAR